MRLRSLFWTIAVLILPALFAVAVVNGCRSGNDGDEDAATDGGDETLDAETQPLFEGWESPAAVLVISGQQFGYLEPCGCTEGQVGGMSRRADLIAQLKKRKWPVTGLELGDVVRRHRRQSEFKFQAITQALADLDYAAIGMGQKELSFDPGFLISQHVVDPESAEKSVTFLCANAVFYGVPGLDGAPVGWKTVTVGDQKIGISSIIGRSVAEKLKQSGLSSEIELSDPHDALNQVLGELEREQLDLKVLLCHADMDESRELAKQFPQWDVIVSSGGYEDPDDAPEQIGKTLLITVGQKGKYAGVVGFFPQDKEPLRYQLVELNRDLFDESPLMHEQMRRYQANLHDYAADVFDSLPKATHPEGRFVGAKKCGECHKKAYAKWSTTRHAHAYESLSRGRKGQEDDWISRIHDPECLACHVTGWEPQEVLRYDSGFLVEDLTDDHRYTHLQGQQCENCHGPGEAHVRLEEQFQQDRASVDREELRAQRQRLHLDLEVAKKSVCVRCHDGDNSPDFDFDKYWPEVKHPWRD